MSAEYALTHQADQDESAIPLQDRQQPYQDGADTSVSILVTPETSMGYVGGSSSVSDLQKSTTANGTATGKTLQIRHSDSFDGSSYAGSSEDSDDGEDSKGNKRNHTRQPSLSMPWSGDHANAPVLTRNDDTEQGVQDEADFLANGTVDAGTRTADQAGAILGIANV